MVQNIALTECRAAFNISTTVNGDVNLIFTKVPIKFKLLAMSQIEWDNYLLDEEYRYDIVRECITQIRANIFGKDHAGSNAYIHLQRQICKLKVNFHQGIRKYEEHLNDFQKYLPFCPWVSSEKLGKQKLPYDKQKLKEILEIAIFDLQQVNLNHNKWMIQDNLVESTIDKLHYYESILLKKQLQRSKLSLFRARTVSLQRSRKVVEGVVVAVVVLMQSSRQNPSAIW